ncbi:MAG: hypothetical protein JSS82_08910 [Bacteroidetes bacterium]|nr:hypothetical protein [Bacteroidota bacterium]
MNNKKIYCIVAMLLSTSLLFGKSSRSYVVKSDTIWSNLECKSKTTASFHRFQNIFISTDYVLKDSFRISATGKTYEDYYLFLTLSPFVQERFDTSTCYNSPRDKRLFVVLHCKKERAVINSINDDFVLNRYEYQSEPYTKMEATTAGFVMKYYIGSSNRCYYDLYFEHLANSFYLARVQYSCYNIYQTDVLTDERKYKPNQYKIDRMNIRSFINIPKLK